MKTMREFAEGSVEKLIGKVTAELEKAALNADADAVHDVRVAIRRANQALRVFAGLVPPHGAKHVRHRLKTVLDAASSVRDCDIAMELYSEVRLPTSHPAWEEVRASRIMAESAFREHVRELVMEARTGDWQSRLGLVK